MLGFSATNTLGRRSFFAPFACTFALALARDARAEPPAADSTATRATSSTPFATSSPLGPVRPSRLPADILLVAGGAFAAGALVTGILAETEHAHAKSTCSPYCRDDEVATGRTLALTSTLLTGTAVVAAAVGAVLYFGGGKSYAAAARSPQLGAFVAPGIVAASTSVRF